MRTCVIFNPAAKGEKSARFLRRLRYIAAESVLKHTGAAGDARRLAAEAAGEGFEVIVAAGGDGTLNEVLNGIADVPAGLDRVRLGVVPLGTVNVFARELGIPQRVEAAWETIRRARETLIDLPYVEHQCEGKSSRRYFAQLAGAGLDARAIELVHWPLKKRIGPLAYVIAGLRALLHPPSTITVTDGRRRATGQLVLIGNGQLYGGPFRVFPGADMRDRQLEVCVFPRVNFPTLARCSPALLFRGRLPPKSSEYFQSASLQLSCSVPTPLEVDGELIGHLPANFALHPSQLRVIVP